MKRTTKMKLFRGMSLILCIIMMMQLTQLFVFAVGEDPPASGTDGEATPIENTPSENLFELGEGELPYAQLQELSPLDVALPETITRTQAIEKGHVNRLYAQEKTLQSVLYQNQNGTKTAYVFDKPVKYVRDGEVLDKDTTIRATGIAGYAYAMTENSFSAYFGSTSTNGVRIQYGDYVFTMKPESSMLVSTPTLGEDAKTIVYNGAFGAQTALRYETQLSGVKEDIILMRNVGKYSFNFLLTTTGLTPVQQENGGWVLMNAEEEIVINFGSIVIKDSAGKTAYGVLNITPRASGGYIMTVTVPQAFLQAANTVYPVYVDPTTVIRETEQFIEYEGSEAFVTDYTAIYDTSVIWGDALFGVPEGLHALHSEAYAHFVFSDFFLSYGQFAELTPNQITKATLYTTPRSCFDTAVMAAPMNSEPSWSIDADYIHTYSFYNWDSTLASTQDFWVCGVVDEACQSGSCPSRGGLITLDFTAAALKWAEYNNGSASGYNPMYGLAVYTNNSGYSDIDYIASVEASGNSSVYYEIDCNTSGETYYVKNAKYHDVMKMVEETDIYNMGLQLYKCIPGSITDSVNEWYITVDETGVYHTISTISSGVKKYLGAMTDGYYVSGCGYVDDPYFELVDEPVKWIITPVSNNKYTFRTQYGYYLYQYGDTFGVQSSLPASTAANYESFLWELANSTTYAPLEELTIQVDSLDFEGTAIPTIMPYPENATWVNGYHFEWESSDQSVITVDKNGCITGVDYGTATISATHRFTGVESSVTIVVGEDLGYGYINSLKNVSSGQLLMPENSNENSTVKVEEYGDMKTTMMWKIEYISDGYFKIQNDITGYYLRAPANNTNGAQITQGAYSDTYGLWRFIKSGNNYKIISKNQYERSASSPLYLSLAGSSVVQSNTLSTNVWNIQTLTMNLNVYYDQAFVEQYENLGSSPQEVLNRLFFGDTRSDWDKMKYPGVVPRTVGQFFKEEFGIKVNINIVYDVYASYPYIADPPCLSKDNPTQKCNCYDIDYPSDDAGDNCQKGYHHKSAELFVTATPASNLFFNAMFTGQKPSCSFFEISEGIYVHQDSIDIADLRGLAEGIGTGNRCAVFAEFNSTSLDEIGDLKYAVTHEILHLLGAEHHLYNSEACLLTKEEIINNDYPAINRAEARIRLTACSVCQNIVNTNKLKRLYLHNS